ncbi:LysR family transcriptional regulator substrate-binding protein [Streptomyces sp. 7R007]
MRLSAAGEALTPHARAVAAAVAAVKAEFVGRCGLLTGQLSLGAGDGVEGGSLPARLGAFPGSTPASASTSSRAPAPAWCRRCARGPWTPSSPRSRAPASPPGFAHRVLVRDEIVAVVACDQPQARRTALDLERLAGTPLITYGPDSGPRPHLLAAFAHAGVPFQAAYGDDSDRGPFHRGMARARLDRLFTAPGAGRAFAELMTGLDPDANSVGS